MSRLIAPGGRSELIGAKTASAVAAVDFFWAGIYRKVTLIVNAARPADDAVRAYLRTSTDGAAFDAGVSDYAWVYETTEMDTTPTQSHVGDNADAQIDVAGFVGNLATEYYSGVIEILFPAQATETHMLHRGLHLTDAGVREHVAGAGYRLSAADVNGVRFLFSGGNITSGEFACYGLK